MMRKLYIIGILITGIYAAQAQPQNNNKTSMTNYPDPLQLTHADSLRDGLIGKGTYVESAVDPEEDSIKYSRMEKPDSASGTKENASQTSKVNTGTGVSGKVKKR